MLKSAVVTHEKDNVATAIKDLSKGESILIDVNGKEVTIEVNEDIPFGHKIAITNINKGEKVLKYGEVIGIATEDISKGDYVHVHNVVSERGRGDLEVYA